MDAVRDSSGYLSDRQVKEVRKRSRTRPRWCKDVTRRTANERYVFRLAPEAHLSLYPDNLNPNDPILTDWGYFSCEPRSKPFT